MAAKRITYDRRLAQALREGASLLRCKGRLGFAELLALEAADADRRADQRDRDRLLWPEGQPKHSTQISMRLGGGE